MHLIESYALAAGQKINKPEIQEEYFPITLDKYVIIHLYSKPIKNYSYWEEVIRWIKAYYPEISFVQIGGKDDQPLPFCLHLQGKTSIRQAAYLIRRAQLLVGTDSFSGHIAGLYDIPSVILYANNYVENVKPYFINPNNFTAITSPAFEYPPFALDVGFRPLDKIDPKFIVEAIIKKLNLPNIPNIPKMEFVGESFHKKLVEWIPNTPFQYPIQVNHLSVRLDYCWGLDHLLNYARNNKVSIYTTKPIPLDILDQIKHNILQLIYEVETPELDIQWFKQLNLMGINWATFTYLPKSELGMLKLTFCDLGTIFHKPLSKPVEIKNQNVLSGKIVCSQGQYFLSLADATRNRPADLNKVINLSILDHEDYYKEIDFMMVVERKF